MDLARARAAIRRIGRPFEERLKFSRVALRLSGLPQGDVHDLALARRRCPALCCAVTAFADRPPPPSKTTGKPVTTKSGLKYFDLKSGTGAEAKPGEKVKVHYTGWLTDGKKFDSSVDRGEPFEFTLGAGQVIKGWDEGVRRHEGRRQAQAARSRRSSATATRGAGGVIPPNADADLRRRAARRQIARRQRLTVAGEAHLRRRSAGAARWRWCARVGAERRRAVRRRTGACSPKRCARAPTCRRTTTRRWTASRCAPATARWRELEIIGEVAAGHVARAPLAAGRGLSHHDRRADPAGRRRGGHGRRHRAPTATA